MGLFGNTDQYDRTKINADTSDGIARGLGQQVAGQDQYLQGLARGDNSVSAQQLRNALGQNVNAQRSMAAGAAPRDQAMAGLMASRNAMSLGAGLAGQQATAGLMERQQAQRMLLESLMRRREQELQNAQANRQMAIGTQPPSMGQQIMGGAMGLGQMLVGL